MDLIVHWSVKSAIIIQFATTSPVNARKDIRSTGMDQNATVVLIYFILFDKYLKYFVTHITFSEKIKLYEVNWCFKSMKRAIVEIKFIILSPKSVT